MVGVLRRVHTLVQMVVQAVVDQDQEPQRVRALPVKALPAVQVLVHRFTVAAVAVLQQLVRRHQELVARAVRERHLLLPALRFLTLAAAEGAHLEQVTVELEVQGEVAAVMVQPLVQVALTVEVREQQPAAALGAQIPAVVAVVGILQAAAAAVQS